MLFRSVRNSPTADWKTGPLAGEWLMGLGALKSKAATEQLVVLDHMMRDPADPNPLQEGIDYNTRMKDDGKLLYFWGNYNKEPTPIFIYANLSLPDRWKVPGANYKVTSARLLFDHNITNSPNDQIRPEDFENEYATGILPQYTVCPVAPAGAPSACSGLPNGTWVSSVASVEGGDGEPIPVGTVLKGLNPATGLFEATNAWYTTLDRDPFGGPNPRFRLKSSKFGQNLPGVEIPQYIPETPSTTNVDLLSIKDPTTGLPLLADSKNWNNYLDESSDIFGNYDPIDGFSIGDCPLTPDLDLMLYVKGEAGKPTVIRSAQLVVTYECPECNAAPIVDLGISSVSIPTSVRKSSVNTLTVSVANLHTGAVPATVTLNGSDKLGNSYSFGPTSVTTPADKSAVSVSYTWTAPPAGTTVTWTASVSNSADISNLNNSVTASTTIRR